MTPSEHSAHPIRELLLRLWEALGSSQLTTPDLLTDDATRGALDTIRAITQLVMNLLADIPPAFTSVHGLNQMTSGFQSVYNEITGYASNPNPGHIANARAQIDQNVMPFLWAFAPTQTKAGTGAIGDAMEDLSRAAKQSIASVQLRSQEYEKSIHGLKERLDSLQSLIDKSTIALSSQKAESDAALIAIQKEVAERSIQQTGTMESLVSQFQKAIVETKAEAERAQSEILSALGKSQNDAAQIVQVVGNIGVTGNYQNIANAETAQANNWRLITILFFLAGIAVAALTLVKFWYEPFSPETVLSAAVRLLYALVITTPAWYSAKESARHRSNADRARQTELELASLGPFIELMPPEAKHQIRQDLTTKYFGNMVSEHSVTGALSFKELAEVVADLLKAAKK